MEIRFVAHASFTVHTNGKRIISDPWLSGKVFNDSWAHVSPPASVDWSGIDYIWISHEHPDHFHLPTLKAIPAADKQRIIVLHQRHASPRMADAIGKLGFGRIRELRLYQWEDLEPGIEVYCGSVGSMDSFLAIRSEDKCLLNLNDCVLNPRQLHYIGKSVGRIDVLFTQFSFANWVGNDIDEIDGAANKIKQMKAQRAILAPAHIVPFASYVYFCSEENQRMNAWINTPQMIRGLGIPELHFMYPGDLWNVREDAAASEHALVRYGADYAAPKETDPTPVAVDTARLLGAARSSMQNLLARYPFQARRIPPLTIHVRDLGKNLRFDPAGKSVLFEEPGAESRARMEMCSQAAWYMFNFPWGAGTLEISGMYRAPGQATEGQHPFFFLQTMMSTKFLDMGGVSQAMRTLRFLWRKKWEISYRFLGRLQSSGQG